MDGMGHRSYHSIVPRLESAKHWFFHPSEIIRKRDNRVSVNTPGCFALNGYRSFAVTCEAGYV